MLLPDPVRDALHDAAADLRRLDVPVSWVRAENLHVTLRFLGTVGEDALGRVREALEAAAASVGPFTATLGGFGSFPPGPAPRVVWAGVEHGGEAFAALYRAVEAALARRGLAPEDRPYRAHVTLGRVRDARKAEPLARALAARAPLGAELRVDAVHLMRSDLDPAGARYSVLARVPLGRAAALTSEGDGP